jgi:hypothetical protein
MRTHFGEEFRLLLPSDFPVFRRVVGQDNVWKMYDQIICPMDAVKPIDNRRGWSKEQLAEYNRDRFEDLLAANWDLIVIDEARKIHQPDFVAVFVENSSAGVIHAEVLAVNPKSI